MSILCAALAACSGGDGLNSGDPVLLRIEAVGTSGVLWDTASPAGVPCSTGISRNAPIVFTFGGAVDPASLPAGGVPDDAITIITYAGGAPQYPQGTFAVGDDPSLPPGNARRVVFTPSFEGPVGSAVPTSFEPNVGYQIIVPKLGGSSAVLTVAGEPLGNDATTCFTVCANSAGNCLVDLVPGAPYVTSTLPDSADAAPPPISASALAGGRVRIELSEVLDASALPPVLARLVDAATGAEIPGGAAYFPAGTAEAGAAPAVIDFVLATPVPAGTTFEIVLGAGLRDLVGQPVSLYGGGAQGTRRLFRTAAAPACPQAPILETFDTTLSRAATSGIVSWAGDGVVRGGDARSVYGTGNFGALVIPAGPSTLDTGLATPPGSGGTSPAANGVFDTTSVLVDPGAFVRCIGPYPLTLRSYGTVVILGTLNGRAGRTGVAAIGTPEAGPGAGQFNNGGGNLPLRGVRGGTGNLGGGDGGAASQADLAGPPLRTIRAEGGFGARVAGQGNPTGSGLPGSGGGEGGFGGFLSPNPGSSPGDLGGLGGAGGSAHFAGIDGGPFSPAPTCQPLPIVNPALSRARAAGAVATFQPPLIVGSAGSGGGGGGDRFDITGVSGDEQGGGGGGGGGGIRISSLGDVTLGATAIIDLSGAPGGTGNVFNGGHGGGGSGGHFWIQSASAVLTSPFTIIDVRGGASGASGACGIPGAGAGGAGIIAIEDADGIVATNFSIAGAPPGVISVTAGPFATGLAGSATSRFFDSGYQSPDWGTPTLGIALGSEPGSSVVVSFQGARAAANGDVDLATLTAPVAASALDLLDGYRFLRFTVQFTSALPTTPGAILASVPPRLEDVSIPWSAPLGCATP